MSEADLLWGRLVPRLNARVSEHNFETWLSSVRGLRTSRYELVLAAPNSFFQEYLEEHYQAVIEEEAQQLLQVATFKVVFEILKQAPLPQPVSAPLALSPETPTAPPAPITDPLYLKKLLHDRRDKLRAWADNTPSFITRRERHERLDKDEALEDEGLRQGKAAIHPETGELVWHWGKNDTS